MNLQQFSQRTEHLQNTVDAITIFKFYYSHGPCYLLFEKHTLIKATIVVLGALSPCPQVEPHLHYMD